MRSTRSESCRLLPHKSEAAASPIKIDRHLAPICRPPGDRKSAACSRAYIMLHSPALYPALTVLPLQLERSHLGPAFPCRQILHATRTGHRDMRALHRYLCVRRCSSEMRSTLASAASLPYYCGHAGRPAARRALAMRPCTQCRIRPAVAAHLSAEGFCPPSSCCMPLDLLATGGPSPEARSALGTNARRLPGPGSCPCRPVRDRQPLARCSYGAIAAVPPRSSPVLSAQWPSAAPCSKNSVARQIWAEYRCEHRCTSFKQK